MCAFLTQWEADLVAHSQQLTKVHLVVCRYKTQLIHSGEEKERETCIINNLVYTDARLCTKNVSVFQRRVLGVETVPPQGVFHRVLVMGSYHHVGISTESNLIQHIVQTS